MQRIFTARTHETQPYLYIGRVAEITGASCKAIRLYESLGILPTPKRRGKYRIYSERDVFLVHMIKFAQQFGFTLGELKEVLAAKVSRQSFPLELANALCEKKRAALCAEIDDLKARDQQIVAMQREMNRMFGPA
jgi:DNA-binding transcriptional MerR regulator